MSNPLLKHLNSMSPEQRGEFAERAGSSPMSLRLAAKGYKTEGRLTITAEFAARIEKASDGELCRTSLSKTCAACPMACATRKE